MTDHLEKELFLKIKNGDQAVFKTLFNKYYAELFRFCLSMVRSETIAEEITQDAFIYLWEKREYINITSSIKSYLFTTIRNKSINYIKNELPKQRLTEDLSSAMLHKTSLENDEIDIKIQVQKAIDTLPEKCKQIFLLSRYSGYTYKEISEELDISIKTVENQMSIAFKKLRILIRKKDE